MERVVIKNAHGEYNWAIQRGNGDFLFESEYATDNEEDCKKHFDDLMRAFQNVAKKPWRGVKKQ